MKVIIAGPRDISDKELIKKVVCNSGIEITELVCGMAPGVDQTAYVIYKLEQGIPCKKMPAAWDDLNAPGAIVRINKFGKKYNVLAGFARNTKMAEYADALIAIWDGKSRGTRDMIDTAKKSGLLVVVYRTDKDQYFRYNEEDRILINLF